MQKAHTAALRVFFSWYLQRHCQVPYEVGPHCQLCRKSWSALRSSFPARVTHCVRALVQEVHSSRPAQSELQSIQKRRLKSSRFLRLLPNWLVQLVSGQKHLRFANVTTSVAKRKSKASPTPLPRFAATNPEALALSSGPPWPGSAPWNMPEPCHRAAHCPEAKFRSPVNPKALCLNKWHPELAVCS